MKSVTHEICEEIQAGEFEAVMIYTLLMFSQFTKRT